MNPLYQMFNPQPQMTQPTTPGVSGQTFANPLQKANFIVQAMRNPAAFVKQAFPDIPDQISNDPGMILNYLQQTRGITNQQLQQVYNTHKGGI